MVACKLTLALACKIEEEGPNEDGLRIGYAENERSSRSSKYVQLSLLLCVCEEGDDARVAARLGVSDI